MRQVALESEECIQRLEREAERENKKDTDFISSNTATGLNVREADSSSFAEPFLFKTMYLDTVNDGKMTIGKLSLRPRFVTRTRGDASVPETMEYPQKIRTCNFKIESTFMGGENTNFIKASFQVPSAFQRRHPGRKRRLKHSSQSAAFKFGKVAWKRRNSLGARLRISIQFCLGTTRRTLRVLSALS